MVEAARPGDSLVVLLYDPIARSAAIRTVRTEPR